MQSLKKIDINIRPLIKTKVKNDIIEKCIIYNLRNIKVIKTEILKILKTLVAKGTRLSEFEKSEITTPKRVGKSQ